MKRIISLFVAVVMCLGMMTGFASASEEQWLWPTLPNRMNTTYITQKYKSEHQALDIGGASVDVDKETNFGTVPIYASKSGKIVDRYDGCKDCRSAKASYCKHGKSCGNYVIIDHGGGIYSRYIHLTPNNVAQKGNVKQGDVIGYMGSTGGSFGVHLHFDIWTGGTGTSGGTVLNGRRIDVNPKNVYPDGAITYTTSAHTHNYKYDVANEKCKCGATLVRQYENAHGQYTVIKKTSIKSKPYASYGERYVRLNVGDKVTVKRKFKNVYGNTWCEVSFGKYNGYAYLEDLKKYTEPEKETNNGRTIDDGIYVIETKLNRDYVLDVSDASTENGANVQIWKKNGTGAQSFRVTYVSDGYYTIVNTNSGKAVDVCNGATKSETNVWQYTINNTDAQLWKIVSAANGSYYIIGKGSGLYLDVDKAKVASGTNVKIYVKNEEYEAQKWYFTRSAVGGTTSDPSTLDINLTQSPSTINQGSMFGLRGTVTSNYKITAVNGYIINSSGSTVQSTTDTPNSKSMDIRPANVNQNLLFDKLSAGEYTLKIVATDASGKSKSSITFFTVKGTESALPVVVTPPEPVTPSPAPTSSIRFELEAVPSGNLPYGKSFSLKGWFRSDCPIVEARAYMLDANKNVVMQSEKASSTTSNYKIQGYKLDNAMKFNKLSPGAYYLKYYVKDANGDTAEWISDKFYIVK